MTPDVNVLLAAARSDHPHHATAREWLEDALARAATVAPLSLQPMVAASFLRLATHPKIFVQPMPVAKAAHFVDALLGMSGVGMAALGGEWPVFRRLCMEKKLAANDLPDAWLAAAVMHQGEHLVTFDRDFRRLLPPRHWTLLLAGGV